MQTLSNSTPFVKAFKDLVKSHDKYIKFTEDETTLHYTTRFQSELVRQALLVLICTDTSPAAILSALEAYIESEAGKHIDKLVQDIKAMKNFNINDLFAGSNHSLFVELLDYLPNEEEFKLVLGADPDFDAKTEDGIQFIDMFFLNALANKYYAHFDDNHTYIPFEDIEEADPLLIQNYKRLQDISQQLIKEGFEASKDVRSKIRKRTKEIKAAALDLGPIKFDPRAKMRVPRILRQYLNQKIEQNFLENLNQICNGKEPKKSLSSVNVSKRAHREIRKYLRKCEAQKTPQYLQMLGHSKTSAKKKRKSSTAQTRKRPRRSSTTAVERLDFDNEDNEVSEAVDTAMEETVELDADAIYLKQVQEERENEKKRRRQSEASLENWLNSSDL